jgi:hypothetical protein
VLRACIAYGSDGENALLSFPLGPGFLESSTLSKEITWKLTIGEMTNVPASHGQWGGYRTSKAIYRRGDR